MRSAAAALAALVCVAATAAAAPLVTVKARTELELAPVRRIPGGVEVSGVLRDRSQGQGVRFADLAVELDGSSRVARTRDDGAFSLTYPITDGVHSIELSFAGDRQYAPTSAARRGFDVTKEPISLSLRTSREVTLGRDELVVAITARAELGPAAVTLALSATDANGDNPVALGEASTDAEGLGQVTLEPARLGAPGRKRLRASFAGNDAYDVASAETEFVLASATSLELDLRATSLRFEDELVGTGRLVDARGDGIDGVAVSLLAGPRRVADTLTSDGGQFRLRIDAGELGEGTNLGAGALRSGRALAQEQPIASYHRHHRSTAAGSRRLHPGGIRGHQRRGGRVRAAANPAVDAAAAAARARRRAGGARARRVQRSQ